jgi:AcrR family transcriptional regulator
LAAGTKDRIISAAVELFNASSVGGVTTNHIAAHLGISPGNLYMNAEADVLWEKSSKREFDPLALQRIVIGNLQLYAKYIFFARELASLLRADKELRDRYTEISTRRMEQLVVSLAPLIEAGILRDVGDGDDLRALAESAWMIGLFCVPYAESVDEPAPGATGKSAKARAARTRAALERGALLVLHLFKPYMEPLAYTALVVLVRSELEKTSLE